jgi:hypothetical protein
MTNDALRPRPDFFYPLVSLVKGCTNEMHLLPRNLVNYLLSGKFQALKTTPVNLID